MPSKPISIQVAGDLFDRLYQEARHANRDLGALITEKLTIALPALLTEAAAYEKPASAHLSIKVPEDVWNTLTEISNFTGLHRAAVVKKVLTEEPLS